MKELLFICCPRTAMLLVIVQQFLRWREKWHVDVSHTTDLPDEIGKVLLLCEPGELRYIIETNINDARGTRFSQSLEKRLRALLGESDREQSHGLASPERAASRSSTYAILLD